MPPLDYVNVLAAMFWPDLPPAGRSSQSLDLRLVFGTAGTGNATGTAA
jgi:hypothetical protein